MRWLSILAVVVMPAWAAGQTTRPAAAGGPRQEAADVLNTIMTRPPAAPLQPDPDPPASAGSVPVKTVAPPKGDSTFLRREGDYVVDRVGRMVRGADDRPEFVFDSDGQAMKDPPMIILPNLKLMQMESAAKQVGGGGLKFRITGMITEYNGRNYILIEKVVVAGSEVASPKKQD